MKVAKKFKQQITIWANNVRPIIKISLRLIAISTGAYIVFIAIATSSISLSQVSEINSKESWLEFFGALLGALVAVMGAYLLDHLKKVEEDKEKTKLAELIIKNFLRHEITNNFEVCGFEHILKDLEKQEIEYLQYGFNKDLIAFKEFDKVKYELLKYNNSLVKSCMEVYDIFYRLNAKGDFKYLTKEELQKLKDLHDTFKGTFNWGSLNHIT